MQAYLKVTIDESMRLITLRLKGAEASAVYTELLLSAYDGIDKPWLYNRLLDYRQFSGLLDYSDVERLAQNWAERVAGQVYTAKVAILTFDALTPVRAAGFAHLFPNNTVRSFDELHTALNWLNAPV